jgi:hypothetical protein
VRYGIYTLHVPRTREHVVSVLGFFIIRESHNNFSDTVASERERKSHVNFRVTFWVKWEEEGSRT